jgi:hypothetical protein
LAARRRWSSSRGRQRSRGRRRRVGQQLVAPVACMALVAAVQASMAPVASMVLQGMWCWWSEPDGSSGAAGWWSAASVGLVPAVPAAS